MDNKSNNKTEMMEIEIKFNKGKTDRVLVHYGDDPEDLAKVRTVVVLPLVW